MSDEEKLEPLPCGAKGVREDNCGGVRCMNCLAIYGSVACPCTAPKQGVPQRTLKVISPTGVEAFAIWQKVDRAWVCTSTSGGLLWMRNNRADAAVEFMKKNGWRWEWLEKQSN